MPTQSADRKVVLVTGATSGIGNAVAKELASRGYVVYGTGRNPPADTMPNGGSSISMRKLDVTSAASVETLVAGILKETGRLDILVACAGMGIAGAVEDSTDEQISAQMDVNFMGTVRTVRACLPAMRASGSGKIIVIGSLAGRIGMPFQAFYSSSKFALEGFIESLRYEVSVHGVQACIIEPGDFSTGFTDMRRKHLPEGSQYRARALRTLAIQEKDEKSGCDPKLVAKKAASLCERRRLPARISIGPAFQRFADFVKRVIPHMLFELFFKLYYRL